MVLDRALAGPTSGARPQLVILGSVARSKSGVPRRGKCLVSRVGPIVSVEEVVWADLLRPRFFYEVAVGPHLEDGGVSNSGGAVTLSQEQDRAFSSRFKHG